MRALIAKIETRSAQADSADGSQTEATGSLTDAIQQRMALSRKLNSIVVIRYARNPAKISAWKAASHLERDPKPKKDSVINPS